MENRCLGEGRFQCLKRRNRRRCPTKGLVFEEPCQWHRDLAIGANEFPLVSCQFEEVANNSHRA
jgi:hypothetical protein